MTPHRFRRLLEAYGADIERWPPAERAQARLLAAQDPQGLGQAVEQARMLDEWLAEDRVDPPSPEFISRVAGQAMASPVRRTAGRHLFARRLRLGFGIAGIGLAGILAGAVACSMIINLSDPPSYHDGWGESSDIFGSTLIQWSD